VLKLRLATSETYLDRNKVRQERTEWHQVIVWGKRAEALHKILSKGSRIFVEGSLRTSSYEAKDGSSKRYRTEIQAQNIILSGGGGRSTDRPTSSSSSGGSGYSDDDYGGAGGPDEDIPFLVAEYATAGERWWPWR